MDDCLSLSSLQLKSILSHHNVPGRSKLTTKRAMCEELSRLGLPLSTTTSSPSPSKRRSPRASTIRPSLSDDSVYNMDDCLSFSYHDLKSILDRHAVPYRSKLTSKDTICQELLKRNLPLSTSSPRASTSRSSDEDDSVYNMDDCLSFGYHDLKSILSHHNVPDRSKLTTKDTMCQELLKRNLPLSSSSPRAQSPRQPSPQAQSPRQPSPQAQSPRQPSPQAQTPRQPSPQAQTPRQTRAQAPVPDMSRLSLLPRAIQLEVLKQLDSETLLNLCQVNKAFAHLCRDEQLWQHFAQRDFNTSTKLLRNATWYDNYRIFTRRQHKLLNLLTPDEIKRYAGFHPNDPIIITEEAANYLHELFRPMINGLAIISNRRDQVLQFVKNYFPEPLKRELLRYYTAGVDDAAIIMFFVNEIINQLLEYNDIESDPNVTAAMIYDIVKNDDELKSILNFTT